MSTPAWAELVGNAAIDEAQKEPAVLEKVKYAFDEGHVTFKVLTGSSQLLLLQEIRESPAARAFFYELWPLLQCELGNRSETAEPSPPLLDRFFSSEAAGDILANVPQTLLEPEDLVLRQAEGLLLQWEGMPALLALSEDDRWQWLINYGYTYLERDLAGLARSDDLAPFR